MKTRFANRSEAGRELAKKLRHFAFHSDAVVLALPRGGVPVAYEIAAGLHLPLHSLVVRKLGVPGHEEYAMGAIASGGAFYLNEQALHQLDISDEEIGGVIEHERKELQRRERIYGSHYIPATNQTLIVVDDGLATGSTMRAAVRALREKQPRQIIVAVPVAPASVVHELESEVEQVAVLKAPEEFYSVGEWYDDFAQTTDEEVRALLRAANKGMDEPAAKPVIF
jgi:putative phosphoribosyl transferase